MRALLILLLLLAPSVANADLLPDPFGRPLRPLPAEPEAPAEPERRPAWPFEVPAPPPVAVPEPDEEDMESYRLVLILSFVAAAAAIVYQEGRHG